MGRIAIGAGAGALLALGTYALAKNPTTSKYVMDGKAKIRSAILNAADKVDLRVSNIRTDLAEKAARKKFGDADWAQSDMFKKAANNIRKGYENRSIDRSLGEVGGFVLDKTDQAVKSSKALLRDRIIRKSIAGGIIGASVGSTYAKQNRKNRLKTINMAARDADARGITNAEERRAYVNKKLSKYGHQNTTSAQIGRLVYGDKNKNGAFYNALEKRGYVGYQGKIVK